MAEQKTLDDLFLDTLKDIYYAEKQIVKTLPKMAKAATSPELKAGFEQHLEESEGHIERLEQVFEMIGKPAREALPEVAARRSSSTRLRSVTSLPSTKIPSTSPFGPRIGWYTKSTKRSSSGPLASRWTRTGTAWPTKGWPEW